MQNVIDEKSDSFLLKENELIENKNIAEPQISSISIYRKEVISCLQVL